MDDIYMVETDIVLVTSSRVGSGVYADVFRVGQTALKLFKGWPNVPPRQTPEGRRQVFRSQCEAYQATADDSYLKHHVAQFYGQRLVKEVIDDAQLGRKDYLLDCCYAVELLAGQEVKAAEAASRFDHIREAFRRLQSLRIRGDDASVFNAPDSEKFKFIDIEMSYPIIDGVTI